VQASGPSPTVLIVDRDVGFLFWLGEVFTKAGCRAIPALDCGQAVSLIRKLSVQLAAVIVNPELIEVAWMIKTLRRSNGQFKVVTISDDDPDVGSTIQTHVTLKRPRLGELVSSEDWLNRAQEVLRVRNTFPGTGAA